MSDYSSIDLYWTNTGDYAIDIRGDIKATEDNWLRSLRQEIRTRVESCVGDWAIYPQLGAGVDDFVGEMNTREMAQELSARLIFSLTNDGLVLRQDLKIDIFPINIRMLNIVIRVNVAGTPGIEDNPAWLEFTHLYETSEKGLLYALGE